MGVLKRAAWTVGVLTAALVVCGVPGTAQAIVGGETAGSEEAKEYPWAVYLTANHELTVTDSGIKISISNCTGSLVDKNWVLTAHHCVTNSPVDKHGKVRYSATDPLLDRGKISLRVGSAEAHSGGTVVKAKRIVPGPDGKDIALVELEKPVDSTPIPIAKSVPAIRTLTIGGPEPAGADVRLLGWGRTCRADSCEGSESLQRLDTKISAGLSCFRDDTAVCTATTVGAGADHGDSGGPAIAKVNGHWELYGVAQHIDDVDTRGKPSTDPLISTYADVSKFRAWIGDTIRGKQTAADGPAALEAAPQQPSDSTHDGCTVRQGENYTATICHGTREVPSTPEVAPQPQDPMTPDATPTLPSATTGEDCEDIYVGGLVAGTICEN